MAVFIPSHSLCIRCDSVNGLISNTTAIVGQSLLTSSQPGSSNRVLVLGLDFKNKLV